MPLVHTIALRGHWVADGARFTRAFGWPRPLPPGEAAYLAGDFTCDSRVWVNDELLTFADGLAALPALAARNRLAVEAAREPGAVRIEVHAADGCGEVAVANPPG